jgi:23S rRNA (cytidine1920-2'-O)/16S rRNA (cytidine1409-2'-O)-methyltransferase
MGKKERIDVFLVENNYFDSREKAKRAIMAGMIYVDGNIMDKPGSTISEDSHVEVKGNSLKYVSRGGLKLEKAVEEFDLSLAGMICMDIGASTGGFTDCMLQNGAEKVYSVDVGYGQLDWKLRNDPRVINMERTNIRYVTEKDVADMMDFISIDVAFISLRLVLPVAYSLMKEGGEIVFLIKPQFEAGREKVKKNGVVKDREVHVDVVNEILAFASSIGFQYKNVSFSPIKGPKGNIEFLGYFKKTSNSSDETMDFDFLSKNVVKKAYELL